MRHVRLDKMTRTQGAVQRQLSGEDAGADDASQLACIITRGFLMCASHA
jgi:hypothetical protein